MQETPSLIRTWAVISILSFLPGAALAQDAGGLGLDLSNEGQNAQPHPTTPTTKEAESPGLDLTAPDIPAPGTLPSSPAAEEKPVAQPPTFSERDITAEDRVKSVQRKLYLKRHRFELAPFLTVSLNDPYYMKLGGTLRGSYFLADTLAVAVRGSLLQVVPSEDVKTAKRTFQSRIFYSQPFYSLLGDVEWSPFYGKVSVMNSILHFDGYLLGGVGVVVTETSGLPGRPGADIGGGLRFAVKDFLTVNVAVVNTTYVDTPAGTTKGATQNVLTLNAGLSVFFPFNSTGREAE